MNASKANPPPVPDKPSGGGDGTPDAPKTHQEALDEALAETFPASDPISPSSAADDDDEPVASERNPVDWSLKRPGDAKSDGGKGANAEKAGKTPPRKG